MLLCLQFCLLLYVDEKSCLVAGRYSGLAKVRRFRLRRLSACLRWLSPFHAARGKVYR